MAADDQPVGDDEALRVLLSPDPEPKPAPEERELLDEDPHWLAEILPPYGVAMGVLALAIGLAPEGGWIRDHLAVLVLTSFVAALVGFGVWHRTHERRTIDQRLGMPLEWRHVRGVAGVVLVVSLVLLIVGATLLWSYTLASHTPRTVSPVEDDRSFPMPTWILPWGAVLAAGGLVGSLVAFLRLPKARPDDLLPSMARPVWVSAVLVVVGYGTTIVVGVTATESPQRWLPLVITVFLVTPFTLWSWWSDGPKPAEADVSAGWEELPDPRLDRFEQRRHRANGA